MKIVVSVAWEFIVRGFRFLGKVEVTGIIEQLQTIFDDILVFQTIYNIINFNLIYFFFKKKRENEKENGVSGKKELQLKIFLHKLYL